MQGGCRVHETLDLPHPDGISEPDVLDWSYPDGVKVRNALGESATYYALDTSTPTTSLGFSFGIDIRATLVGGLCTLTDMPSTKMILVMVQRTVDAIPCFALALACSCDAGDGEPNVQEGSLEAGVDVVIDAESDDTDGAGGAGEAGGVGGAAGQAGGAAGAAGQPVAVCQNASCEEGESCGSCPQDCGVCVPAFVDPPIPAIESTTLTCDFPWAEALDSNVQVGVGGSDVTSVVGIDNRFGGVGAKFELLNNQSPGNWVNVLEARSGAGAGWQTSFLIEDWPGGAGIIVFNQAAGNSTGYQWGYGNGYSEDGQNIFATGWNPLYSDHIHGVPGAHSPCATSGYVFDDGAVAILGALVDTPHGSVVAWKNLYRYRSRVDQAWKSWSAEQAFYLSRGVARMGGLRLFLRRGTTMDGPFAPYDPYTIPGALCDQVNGSHCNAGPYDYVLFVWNVFGLDIGVAIPVQGGISMNLETVTYCSDAGDDACGNINFHSWLPTGNQTSFATGEVRTLSQVYYVGTLPQLAELGYTAW